jgi:hypothetical protein
LNSLNLGSGHLEKKKTLREMSLLVSSPSISEYQKLRAEAKPISFIPYSINNNGLFDKGYFRTKKNL